MSAPADSIRTTVRWWRLGLLLGLGATILFASHSYDDWTLITRYLRVGLREEIDQRRAAARQEILDRRRREQDRREARVEGSVDGIFKGPVQALEPQSDGGLLVGGAHTRAGLGLARLLPDGSLDRAFTDRATSAGVAGSVEEISRDDTGFVARGFFQEKRHPFRSLDAVRFRETGDVDRESLDQALRSASQTETHYARPSRIRADLGNRVADQLPGDARLEHVMPGPGRSALVFYGERVPEASETGRWVNVYEGPGRRSRRIFVAPFLCGVDAALRTRYRSQVAVFDREGNLSAQADSSPPAEVESAHLQSEGTWIVRGRVKDGSDRETVLWRVVSRGTDPSFKTLMRSDLVDPHAQAEPAQAPSLVLASAVQADGRIVVGGSFTSIRGRPRLHIARLRPDGALDE